MKIRIRGNRVRFRLTQEEVAQVGTGHKVLETTEFGDALFSYSVNSAADLDDVNVNYINNSISVRLPAKMASEWAESDQVGISTNIGNLALLVEKDFKCLTVREGEDESDMFANPNETC